MNPHLIKVYNRAKGRFNDKHVAPFVGTWRLDVTEHAKQQARTDRYGELTLPAAVTITPDRIVEIETYRSEPYKAVVRLTYDKNRDLVLTVLAPVGGEVVVKTVWCNLADDKHSTLNYNRLR